MPKRRLRKRFRPKKLNLKGSTSAGQQSYKRLPNKKKISYNRLQQQVSALSIGATNKFTEAGSTSVATILGSPTTTLMSTYIVSTPTFTLNPGVAVGVGNRTKNSLQVTSCQVRGSVYPSTLSVLATDGVASVRVILCWIKDMYGNPGVAAGSAYPSFEDMMDAPSIGAMTAGYVHLPKTYENNKNFKFLVDKTYTLATANSGALKPIDFEYFVDCRNLGSTKYNAMTAGAANASQGQLVLFAFSDNVTVAGGGHLPILEYALRMYYIE